MSWPLGDSPQNESPAQASVNIPNYEASIPQEATLEQRESLAAFGRSANTTWVNDGGSDRDDAIYEMALDSNGDIVVCGSIYRPSQLGSILVETWGEGDILVAKLSVNGVWLWAVSAGTALYYDECRGLAIDDSDNVYATGYFRDTVQFGSTNLTGNSWDGYVWKLLPNGSHIDAFKFGGFDIDVGWDVDVQSDYEVVVAGYFRNESAFGQFELEAAGEPGDPEFFAACYNMSTGLWQWAVQSNGNGLGSAFQLVVDRATDSTYVVGYTSGSEIFNNSFVASGQSTYSAILVKYDANGTYSWGKKISGPSCQFVNCGAYLTNVVLHPNGGVVVGGNFLIHAKFMQTVELSSGAWDVFVAHYSAGGVMLSYEVAGSAGDDRLQALGVMPDGTFVMGGRHDSSMDFSTFTLNHTQGSKNQMFIAKTSASGGWKWALTTGGNGNDSVEAMLTLSDGSIIAGGEFTGSTSFGSTIRHATQVDLFVWRFQHDADNDGIPDADDNCYGIPNVNQSNHDGDAKGDVCEIDDDNDGLHDVLDDCPLGTINWNQSNTSLDHDSDGCKDSDEDQDDDNDGILDGDDNCPAGILDWSPDNSTDMDSDGCRDSDEDLDDDGDTVPDTIDNCPVEANTNQSNYDFDALGDVCDSDVDGDSIADISDDCRYGLVNWTSVAQTDNDGDGCNDDTEDEDDDNDGMNDTEGDDCPRGASDWTSTTQTDHDSDGCKDSGEDGDDDNDGIIDSVDQCSNGVRRWQPNASNDRDSDGCRDMDEDGNDDNDEFMDSDDDCPYVAGSAYLGGMRGCPDFDEDGWADEADAFYQDETQWADGDGDGFGDNKWGNLPDDCPLVVGNSTEDRLGCLDSDGDGYSDPDALWKIADGADALIHNPEQQFDSDGDGYGDNIFAANGDRCTSDYGTSTKDRLGCKDSDGDGWSDPDSEWSLEMWDTLNIGPDFFQHNNKQWFDTDGDGFGDNWGDSLWNDSRQEGWPGEYIEGATISDFCPLVNSKLTNGCPAGTEFPVKKEEESTTTTSDDNTESSSSMTYTLIGVGSGLVLLLLGVVIVMMRKPEEKTKKKAAPVIEEEPEQVIVEQPRKVSSWEELPAGDYLDPDEHGTIWFRAEDGSHWFQDSDGSWLLWQD